MFTILDKSNETLITMNNPYTGENQAVITDKDKKSIAYAIFCFAMNQHIPARKVEYSIRYPEEQS